jgi:hypothetical protein
MLRWCSSSRRRPESTRASYSAMGPWTRSGSTEYSCALPATWACPRRVWACMVVGVWLCVWLLYVCLEATLRAVHVPARPDGRRTCPVPVLAVLVARGSTRRGALVRASVLSPWRASHDVMLTACRCRAAGCVQQRGGQVQKSERKERGRRYQAERVYSMARRVVCCGLDTKRVSRKAGGHFSPSARASGVGRRVCTCFGPRSSPACPSSSSHRHSSHSHSTCIHYSTHRYTSMPSGPPLRPKLGVGGRDFSTPKNAMFSRTATYSLSANPSASLICVECRPLIRRISVAE